MEIYLSQHTIGQFFEDHVKKTALKGISKFQHFRFSRSAPGAVYVKNSSAGVEKKITLLKDELWKPSPNDLPQTVVPNGLSPERKLYLYEKIREFCTDSTKDLVCPKPPSV